MEILDELFIFRIFVNFKAYELPLNIKRFFSNFLQSVFYQMEQICGVKLKKITSFEKSPF